MRECDDGNTIEGDECLSNRRRARCGDGIQAADEQCDDGNADPTDACAECQLPSCGDGRLQEGELCDDGNEADDDACTTACAPARCGDGFRYIDHEDCDDGNLVETDLCTNACQIARCGDGVVRNDRTPEDEGFEDCDDGNTQAGDGCSDRCLTEACGNGRLDPGEVCDDGNRFDEDDCTAACREAICGDGIVGIGRIGRRNVMTVMVRAGMVALDTVCWSIAATVVRIRASNAMTETRSRVITAPTHVVQDAVVMEFFATSSKNAMTGIVSE